MDRPDGIDWYIKWFSSGDSQTSIQKYGAVTNCYFESQVPSSENIPYDIILNGRGIVDVVNSHGDGRLRLKSSANISNSSFAETEINQVRDGAIININNFYLRPKKIISTRYEKKALSKKIKPLYLEVKKILD